MNVILKPRQELYGVIKITNKRFAIQLNKCIGQRSYCGIENTLVWAQLNGTNKLGTISLVYWRQ